jgi:hypothetical protein
VVGEVLLQLGVALEERQVALIGHAVKIVDLGDKAVPVLPEYFDRLHGQGALGQLGVKPAFEKPAIRESQTIFFKIRDDLFGLLRRQFFAGVVFSVLCRHGLLLYCESAPGFKMLFGSTICLISFTMS